MGDEKLAKRLRKIMEERNLKQVDILKLTQPYCEIYNTKMNKSDISQYLSKKNKPSFEKVYILAKALDVPLIWLTGYGDEEIPKNQKDSSTEKLLYYFEKLNKVGQEKAIVQVWDLTKIEEYRKS